MKPFVLLIAPPVYDFALYDLFLKPYGLLRIGKWLSDYGFRVKLINALDYNDRLSGGFLKKPKRLFNGTGKFYRDSAGKPHVLKGIKRNYARYGIAGESIEQRLKEEKPDLVLISSGMTYWYPGVREAVRLCKKTYPEVPVAVGGVYATLCREHAEKVLETDYIISGSVYPAVLPVLKHLSLPVPGKPPEEEPLILKEVYGDAAVVRINTGCPFRCRYCASSALNGDFKQGSAEKAFSTVKNIHDNLGTVNFAFYDDALLLRKETVLMPFLRRIMDSGLKLNFYVPNGIHLASINAETASLMFRAGFKEVRIGFESASDDFHRNQDKKLDIDQLEEGVEILKNAGFSGGRIGVYLLAGLPNQYSEEVEESIRFVSRFGVKISVAEYSPVPGTGLFKESVKSSCFPIAEEPLFHNNSIMPMQWRGFTYEDLDRLKSLARSVSVLPSR
ncbi:MAG: radical SAM protein [Spirochaetes bacterium]|nr:radical SAM protein [Spirochaetota bacterium]